MNTTSELEAPRSGDRLRRRTIRPTFPRPPGRSVPSPGCSDRLVGSLTAGSRPDAEPVEQDGTGYSAARLSGIILDRGAISSTPRRTISAHPITVRHDVPTTLLRRVATPIEEVGVMRASTNRPYGVVAAATETPSRTPLVPVANPETAERLPDTAIGIAGGGIAADGASLQSGLRSGPIERSTGRRDSRRREGPFGRRRPRGPRGRGRRALGAALGRRQAAARRALPARIQGLPLQRRPALRALQDPRRAADGVHPEARAPGHSSPSGGSRDGRHSPTRS